MISGNAPAGDRSRGDIWSDAPPRVEGPPVPARIRICTSAGHLEPATSERPRVETAMAPASGAIQ